MESLLAYDKLHQDVKEVAIINFIERTCFLWGRRHGNVRITIARDFDDVEFLNLTIGGIYENQNIKSKDK